jgi:hypothetical protein
LGIGDWAQSPIPNPQSPIPNPQSPSMKNYYKILYLICSNYIKINNKPAIMISDPLIFKNVSESLFILREKTRENEIGELFIFSPLNKNFNESEYILLFDAIYDFPKTNFFDETSNKQKREYYSGIIYKNIIFNNAYNNYNNFSLYRTSILQINNTLLISSVLILDFSIKIKWICIIVLPEFIFKLFNFYKNCDLFISYK